MNRIEAAANLCITGFYLYHIGQHMVRPGENGGYTRMLVFACLATIPMVFMLVMIGGRDRWVSLLAQAKEFAAGGPLALLLMAALAFLLVLMPLGMLVAIWFSMGLKFGSLFILYFVPMILRLVLGTTQECVLAAIARGVSFFASFLIGIGIVMILQRFFSGVGVYGDHFELVWPGYRDGAKMFFSVCTFALIGQLLEFRHALLALVRHIH